MLCLSLSQQSPLSGARRLVSRTFVCGPNHSPRPALSVTETRRQQFCRCFSLVNSFVRITNFRTIPVLPPLLFICAKRSRRGLCYKLWLTNYESPKWASDGQLQWASCRPCANTHWVSGDETAKSTKNLIHTLSLSSTESSPVIVSPSYPPSLPFTDVRSLFPFSISFSDCFSLSPGAHPLSKRVACYGLHCGSANVDRTSTCRALQFALQLSLTFAVSHLFISLPVNLYLFT